MVVDMYWPVARHLPLGEQLGPPASRWLDSIPQSAHDELLKTVTEVTRYSNPKTYHRVARGRWEAMTGAMQGIFEARDRLGEELFRLFAFFDDEAGQHGGQGPILVLVAGARKPNRSAFADDVYQQVLDMRKDCLRSPRPYRDLILAVGGRGYIDPRYVERPQRR